MAGTVGWFKSGALKAPTSSKSQVSVHRTDANLGTDHFPFHENLSISI